MRMEDDGSEIRWVGLEPADIHLLDQTSAKFADLLQRMVNKSLDSRQDYSDTPDPVKAMRDFQEFGVLVQEIESPLEMVSFMAYVMAALTKTGFQLEFMSVGMANILDNVITSMVDEKARQRFQELRRETVFSSGVNSFSDIKAEDLLKRLESYTTGTGKRVVGVHRGEDCEGFCVIHNTVSGPWDQWPTD